MRNGKINRGALPVPQSSQIGDSTSYTAPRTSIEQCLESIFSDVLGFDQISIHESFFDRGGHSLSATKVISRIRTILQQEVPLIALFEAPTIASLSAKMEKMKAESDRIAISIPELTRIAQRNQLPLSFAQERLWFMSELIPDSSFYNMPLTLKLAGKLNVDSLRRSIAEVIIRHEGLRTTFVLSGNDPVQIFKSNRINAMIMEESVRPFDLSKGPLMRAKLIQVNDEEHILIIVTHHIVSDGWSITILQKELALLYESFSLDKPSPLPEPILQYADFAVWQRQWLQGELLDRQMDYWKKQLDGICSLSLPCDYIRPPVLSYQANVQEINFSAAFANQLKELSKMETSTLYMTLMTAFEILLFKYTGQEDIAIGSPIANRNRKETEAMIGFFVNTQVIRVQVDHELTFKELLAQVKEVTLGAYSHQDVPFEQIVAELQPERDLSRNPLVQVMFALQDASVDDFKFGDVEATLMETTEITTRFDMEVHFWKNGEGLKAEFIYSTDLFSEETISGMLSNMKKILKAVVENPDQQIGSINMLDASDRSQLLITMNNTMTNYPRDKSIVDIFEEQVYNSPNSLAVVSNSEELTYLQLHQRSNQLAKYLTYLGVRIESPVAVCMQRSPLMIVALLAILKAGGAYVPLDSQYPEDRLSFMLKDTGASVIICERSTVGAFTNGEQKVVCLDEMIDDLMKQSNASATVRPTSTNIAYIISFSEKQRVHEYWR
ncbi:hypothetical protein K7432_017044 [Basidiobolus ranarum]|uniref:Carrier domain-containing protein n=1 Tax=Basidiobolus ranarum TaxID=34480 RepID=A0ABR2WDX3_9FUNG